MSVLLTAVFLCLIVLSVITLIPGLSSVRIGLCSIVSSFESSLHLSAVTYAILLVLVGVLISAGLDYRSYSALTNLSPGDRYRLLESERDMILASASLCLALVVWLSFLQSYDLYRADIRLTAMERQAKNASAAYLQQMSSSSSVPSSAVAATAAEAETKRLTEEISRLKSVVNDYAVITGDNARKKRI